MILIIAACCLVSALLKTHLSLQSLSSKSSYPEVKYSTNGVPFISRNFGGSDCPWDANDFYASLFGLKREVGLSAYQSYRQLAYQFGYDKSSHILTSRVLDTAVSTGKLKLADTNVQKSVAERDSVVKLPSLEDAAVGDMEQNPIPTFNEFHAMLYEEHDVTKADPGSAKADTFATDGLGVSVGGSSSFDTDQPNGSRSDDDPKLKGDHSTLHDANLNSGSPSSSEVTVDTNDSKGIDIGVFDPKAQTSAGSAQTNYGQSSTVANAGPSTGGTYSSAPVTLRRNVAASGCFAKLLEASKAIRNPDAILNENTDEYMNAPCSAEKWFVIEVCEPVMLREIELANYELFSSRVKLFRVYVSDRYPAKSWDSLGTFMALDVKGKQTFKVNGDKLIKYVKFDMVEHYGSEHYCPLTTVRLFGRVSDDLDDEDDELTGNSMPESRRSFLTEEGANLAIEANGANSIHAGGDQASDVSAAVPHTTDLEAPLDLQSTHLNSVADAGSQTISESPREVSDENPSIALTTANFSQPLRNSINGIPHTTQTPATESTQTGDSAAKLPDSQSVQTDKRLSSESEILNDVCLTGSLHLCLAERFSEDANINVADGEVEHRTEPSYPLDEPQTHRTLTSNSTVRTAFAPLRTPDYVPVTGQAPSSGFMMAGTFFNRIRNFFLDLFGSSSWLSSTESETLKYNLSTIDLCPHHLSAIDALLSYGLLSHLGAENSPDLMITLPEQQLHGLQSLARCFYQLDQRVRVFNSDHSNPRLTIQHRVLVLPANAHQSYLSSCNTAAKLLNISFTAINDSSSVNANDQGSVQYNILQLFLAYQYRIQLYRHPVGESALQAPVSTTKNEVHKWWMSGLNQELVPQNRSTCPKLPDFLLHLMSFPTVDPPAPPTPHTDRCTNGSADPIPHEPAAPHLHISTPMVREEIVVPAALAGSRKDTALMRLTNRVRLLERNVSVSMRYLEALSQSYKRQMERLSRSFNLTTVWLKATAESAEERDRAQQVRMSTLEQRLDGLMSQFRSVSTESHESNDFTPSSVSKSSRDVTLELDKVSAPPPLNFDAPPDWNPGSSNWPGLADDWLEDGIVETEDDDPIVLHQHSVDSDRFRQIRPYRPEGALIAGDWSSRDCEPPPISGWKPMVQRWFIEQFGVLSKFKTFSWPLPPATFSSFLWISYMTLVHLAFAAISHVIVYLTWLRPQSRKLSCTFDSVHQSPFTWASSNHLTLSSPNAYYVSDTHRLDSHNVTVFPSNGKCSLQLSVSPRNHTTVYSKFPQLAATAYNTTRPEPIDTIGTSTPFVLDTHRLPNLCSLREEPSNTVWPLSGIQAPVCSSFSEPSISYLPTSESLTIRTDDSSSTTPSPVASFAPQFPPVLSKRARKRRNRRARAK